MRKFQENHRTANPIIFILLLYLFKRMNYSSVDVFLMMGCRSTTGDCSTSAWAQGWKRLTSGLERQTEASRIRDLHCWGSELKHHITAGQLFFLQAQRMFSVRTLRIFWQAASQPKLESPGPKAVIRLTKSITRQNRQPTWTSTDGSVAGRSAERLAAVPDAHCMLLSSGGSSRNSHGNQTVQTLYCRFSIIETVLKSAM